MRGLDFTSRLHRNFLVRLAGLDLARMHNRGPALLSVFTWNISSPPTRDPEQSIAKSCLEWLAFLSCKQKQILQA